jgi:hypothetical protein
MKLLTEPPRGFEGISKAFAMAKQIPTSHRLALRCGLARNGELFALGELDGYRQVTFFSEHIREAGYREHLLGGEDDMLGCDLLFSAPAASVRVADADPSFIRRPAAQLWPARA